MRRILQELIDLTRGVEMSPGQAAEQRRSFAYGNLHIANPLITREVVAELDGKLYPPPIADKSSM